MSDSISSAVYGIVLLPSVEDSQHCIDASTLMNEAAPSLVVLNSEDSRAHVTIVHVETDIDSVEAIWGALKGRLKEAEAETFSFYIRPLEGVMWVGFEVRKTSELMAFHNFALKACEAHQIPVLSEHGDSYWPHMTLGCWRLLPSRQLPISDMRFDRFWAMTPALAKMGDHGVVSEVMEIL